jgi:hypothetical protein
MQLKNKSQLSKTRSNLTLKNELAVTELIKNFRHENTWLEADLLTQWVVND